MVSIFDKKINRKGSGCYKWDISDNPNFLPLWVADMDFQAAPEILDALKKRIEHGVFGYTKVMDGYYDALTNWFKKRHNWAFDAKEVIYTSGVLPAIAAILKAIVMPGDNVLINSPVYNCFYSNIRNAGCQVQYNPLKLVKNRYEIDFDDFEQKASDSRTTVFLLCNPHNPAGRVWTYSELERLGQICLKHNVFVISDEIHCELTFPNINYTPFASISDVFANNCAVCTSPSKAFNIAGLMIANIICRNKEIRRRIDRAININETCDVNPFGVDALQAAYNNCAYWLDDVRCYIKDNYDFLCNYVSKNIPFANVVEMEGTYLAWMDISGLKIDSTQVYNRLLKNQNLMVSPGYIFGNDGNNFIRINLATSQSILEEGLNRIVEEFCDKKM